MPLKKVFKIAFKGGTIWILLPNLNPTLNGALTPPAWSRFLHPVTQTIEDRSYVARDVMLRGWRATGELAGFEGLGCRSRNIMPGRQTAP